MAGSAFVPTIYSDPACGTTVDEPNSTVHPGTFEWVIQAETDPRNTISVDQPIRGRMLDIVPGTYVLGETYKWTGAWILWAAYGGSVGFAGDIIYLPMGVTRDYTVEYYQLAEDGAASEIVSCTMHVNWDRTKTAVTVDQIKFRAWDEINEAIVTEGQQNLPGISEAS